MGDQGTSGPTHTAGTRQAEEIKSADGKRLEGVMTAPRAPIVRQEPLQQETPPASIRIAQRTRNWWTE